MSIQPIQSELNLNSNQTEFPNPSNSQPITNNTPSYPKETFDIESGETADIPLFDISQSMRLGFIRKVYGILSLQLMVTVIMTSFSFMDAYKEFCRQNTWLFLLALGLNILIVIPLICFSSISRKVPINYILLLIWTSSESYMVSVACSFYDPKIILSAAGLTLTATIGLTLYAIYTKTDFTFLGGLLWVSAVVLFFSGVLLLWISILKVIYQINRV